MRGGKWMYNADYSPLAHNIGKIHTLGAPL